MSTINDIITNIDRIIKLRSYISVIDGQIGNNLEQLLKDAMSKYTNFMNNSNNITFDDLLKADQEMANYMESKYKQSQSLTIEIISGDQLKQKIESLNIPISSKYSGVRYIINKEFGLVNGSRHFDMVLGNFHLDFKDTTKWFILSDNNLIVSVLCWLSNKIPTINNPTNDNLQSFGTRSDNLDNKFRSQGYNQILMKYASQYINQSGCSILTLGVEPYNFGLINVYRKVGFELIPSINGPNKYMKYICPSFETINFVLPVENNPPIAIPSFELPTIIQWPGENTETHFKLEFNDNGTIRRINKNISSEICNSASDPTNRFDRNNYIREYDIRLNEAKDKFNLLNQDQQLDLYNKARELSELSLWGGNTHFRKNEVRNESTDIGSMNDIYDIVKIFKPGYENNYYMTKEEYQTTNNTIKLRVAKRYYITEYLINNISLNGVKLIDGIYKWRFAYYDIRTIFLKAIRQKITEYNNKQNEFNKIIYHSNYDNISKTMTTLEAIFWDNLMPHAYHKLSFLRNNINKDLVMDYINKNTYPNTNEDHEFVSIYINPYAHMGPDYKAIDPLQLSEEQVISGIGAVYLLSWEYEHFLTNMIHEIMHKFRESDDLNHILFDNLYPYIDKLANETSGLENPIRKVELIADLISFSIMSIMLEHSNLNYTQQYNKIKNMPLPLCGGHDIQHPPASLRLNSLRLIPHIYQVFSNNI
ncbi:acyl-CoA N-acyltransferase [Fadolivirus algeromassiliense]|jgi:hypothetical protein|uniref:Acyl-CoA N-acyltransferase n=1 Tax=Fadolivirus FV1/VV64 TaxID=3070911 RepID=A0A7D3UUN2_9VIRU|nr:acyl-CoA N-acyltransferase [Fadolivirus algeromassiliense]QKF93629.1 acyl-CoA N-acyltransferase [Fadolivirus FV1/VV64]